MGVCTVGQVLSRWSPALSIKDMRHVIAALAILAVAFPVASAQFPDRIKPGVRVRVWLQDEPQDNAPWARQLLRGTVSETEADVLRLTVPGTAGTLAVARSGIRRLDVSRGRNRGASMLERAFGFAVVGAINAAAFNDPDGREWPAHDSRWVAAGQGAAWGAGVGAVIGLLWPTERWSRVRLPRL